MAELETAFKGKLREAMLDDAEQKLVGEADNLAFTFVERVHERLRRYGDQLNYNVEPIIDSLEYEEVKRTDTSVSVKIGWEHEASAYFEFGTRDHKIEGDPILRFVWESRHDPPDWVKQEYEQARGEGGRFQSGWVVYLPEVEVAGIQKIRQVRTALRWFRREVRK